MLVAISKYLKPIAEVDVHRPAHIAYAKKYFAEGKLLVGGRQIPGTAGAVIISKTATPEEFKVIIHNDPYVLAGVAEYTIFEFVPALWDTDFEKIFATEIK